MDANAQKVNVEYKKRTGDFLFEYAGGLVAQTFMIADALERAGSADPQKVRDALATLDVSSGYAAMAPGGKVKFAGVPAYLACASVDALNAHPAAGHLGFLLLLVLSLGPVFAVDIPAMVDYPNHLARMYVLSRAGTAAASSFYQVTWGFYPNLAMDLIVPPLARFISVDAATQSFLGQSASGD